jgi:hypothetical protein
MGATPKKIANEWVSGFFLDHQEPIRMALAQELHLSFFESMKKFSPYVESQFKDFGQLKEIIEKKIEYELPTLAILNEAFVQAWITDTLALVRRVGDVLFDLSRKYPNGQS